MAAQGVVTGPELRVGPFVLFSTRLGDAWLLNPYEQFAMCLVWRGEREEVSMGRSRADGDRLGRRI
jgi:hypothetical protein